MTGFPRESETIAVQVGWNMIGSISSSVDVTTITSNPPGLITSQFFSYENGYDVSTTIEPGKGYWVKVNQAGTLTLSSVASNQYSENSIKIVSTNEQPPPPPTSETTNQKPQVFNLEQNHPNPFNPSTVIRYSLPVTGLITLKVYNMLGQEVATLLDNQEMEQGEYEISFNANMFATGVYFYRINVESVDEDGMKQIFTDVKRMLLLK
ncbi:MAG: T9SS type A sorting domain-containing protein [Ignavibacteriae bacterium]|nr:T9SS type A sorting domain-containing protein [Ignavibacteriota bacterium]